MSRGRPVCQEDFFDYHVKKIFRRLRKEHAEEELAVSFEDWLDDKANDRAIASAFLEDVVEWSGIPDEDDCDD